MTCLKKSPLFFSSFCSLNSPELSLHSQKNPPKNQNVQKNFATQNSAHGWFTSWRWVDSESNRFITRVQLGSKPRNAHSYVLTCLKNCRVLNTEHCICERTVSVDYLLGRTKVLVILEEEKKKKKVSSMGISMANVSSFLKRLDLKPFCERKLLAVRFYVEPIRVPLENFYTAFIYAMNLFGQNTMSNRNW